MSGTIYLLKEQDKVKEDITPMTDVGYNLFVERTGHGQRGYNSDPMTDVRYDLFVERKGRGQSGYKSNDS